MTSRTIEARQAGPIVAELSLSHGRIEVIVERRHRAEVTVSTTAKDGPAAEAIANFALRDIRDGFRAHLEIPPTVVASGTVIQSGGGVVIAGNNHEQINVFSGRGGSVIQVGGTIHGSVVVGAGNVVVGGGANQIEMQVRLPEGSSIVAEVRHCSLRVKGHLREARVSSAHGNVDVERVGPIIATLHHGSLVVAGLDGAADVVAHHGDVDLTALQPVSVRARAHHGDITTRGARVDLDASAHHGKVRSR